MSNILISSLIALLATGPLASDSYGFLNCHTLRSPESFSECLKNTLSLNTQGVRVEHRDGVYTLSDSSGFALEIGRSISTGRTLLRLRSSSNAAEEDIHGEQIISCL